MEFGYRFLESRRLGFHENYPVYLRLKNVDIHGRQKDPVQGEVYAYDKLLKCPHTVSFEDLDEWDLFMQCDHPFGTKILLANIRIRVMIFRNIYLDPSPAHKFRSYSYISKNGGSLRVCSEENGGLEYFKFCLKNM